MKLASFLIDDRPAYGLLVNGAVNVASADFRARYPTLRDVIAAQAQADLAQNVDESALAAAELRFLPPLPNAGKIICVGVNYRPHIKEMGRQVPDFPVVFTRFASSLVGHEQPIVRPSVSHQLDFEGELAVVIGRAARHVSRELALDCVAGYSCFMDGSVRDFQRHTTQFTAGKNFDRSGAMGPAVATADEVGDPRELELTTRVNGEVMQTGRVAELVFDIAALIEYCSTFTELLPGDVIATGTPGGVGAARKPPVWLQADDTVEVGIPGVGVLLNRVMDETRKARR
ncbi:MAG: fumarylacetoacetate hydrolase family protein [Gammaproteobacteria bacterium]|nr:fumarylacetoacetate hydrolase family protein [Gammaproteobacteria bacterium]